MAEDFHQYSGIKPFVSGYTPKWVADEMEALRLASYTFYERVYWTEPGTFKLMMRGAEDKPIYIPSGRTIVETLWRYLATGMSIVVNPAFGADNEKDLAAQVWADIEARERFASRFATNKRHGIIRGDSLWYFYADPNRPAGSRVSILRLDPSKVFKITDPDNKEVVIGYHIVEHSSTKDGKPAIHRTTYRKAEGVGGPSTITVEEALYEVDEWGGPGMDEDDAKVLEVIRNQEALPAPIDDLPIYAIPNVEGDYLWGSSELRGIERLMGGINQSVSDEDLSLALDGLGVYATTAGTPIDPETNEELPWNLGPGRVVELPESEQPVDKVFARVSGLSSVVPWQDHLKYIHAQLDEAIGQPAVAKGKVDVSVAESGIALLLEHGPILSRAEERDQAVMDVLRNLLFNFPKWMIAYEGGAFRGLLNVRLEPKFGPKLPVNKKESVAELLTINGASPRLLPSSYIRDKLRGLGYEDMPSEDEIVKAIDEENKAAIAAAQEAFASETGAETGRAESELASGDDGEGEGNV